MSARQRTGPLLLLVLVLGAAWVLARSFGLIKFLSLNNAARLRAIILGFGPIDGISKASAER